MTVIACPPNTPPVTGVVVFVPADFKTAYAMFATVADSALQLNFTLATLILNNTCRSIVVDAAQRETMLYLLVAHITALRNGVNGAPPAGLVGRIDSATEGTVSVSAEYATLVSGSMAWFIQTQWGALFWQITLPFRSFRYIPAPGGPLGLGDGSLGGWPGRCGC